MGNQTLLLIAIMVLVVVVGTAMDMTPTILILTPVLMPVVKAAGIDPVYFGVLFIINNAIGLITPPVGTVLNVVAGVARISMDDVIKGVWPFMLAQLIVLFLLVLFPALVTVPAAFFSGSLTCQLSSKKTTFPQEEERHVQPLHQARRQSGPSGLAGSGSARRGRDQQRIL